MIEIFKSAAEIDRTEMKYADLHIHTKYSDGKMIPEQVVDFACRTGFLNAVALTDHDTIASALEAKEYAKDMGANLEVVIGSEISTQDGHLIGLYLREDVKPGQLFESTVAEIHQQGGLVIIPHPLFQRAKSLTQADLEFRIKRFPEDEFDIRVDGFEVYNAEENDISPETVEEAGFQFYSGSAWGAPIASTDAHHYMIGRGITGFYDDLREAILKESTVAFRADEDDLEKYFEIAKNMFPGVRLTSSIERIMARKERNKKRDGG